MLLLWQDVSLQNYCNTLNITEIALEPNEKPFPLSEFLNASGIDSSAIQWRGLQCKRWLQKGECKCNVGCQSSGNCCIDFLWDQFAFNNQSDAQNVKNYQQKVIESSKSQRCLPLFPFEKEIDEYYIMVDSCVSGANEIDIERCLNSSLNAYVDQMPVLGDDKYLYKNRFCARCNGVYKYSSDIFYLVCSKDNYNNRFTAIELLKSNRNCSTRSLMKNSVLKCDKKRCRKLDATLCRLISAEFELPSFEIAKNPFCSKCEKELTNSVYVTSCQFPLPEPERPWSRTIDLNDFKEICGVNQVKRGNRYHHYCVRKLCGKSQALINGKCQDCKKRTKVVLQKKNENDKCECDLLYNVIDSKGNCICKEGSVPSLFNSLKCVCLLGQKNEICLCPMGSERRKDSKDKCTCKLGYKTDFKENKCVSKEYEKSFETVTELKCLSKFPHLKLYVFMKEESDSSLHTYFHPMKLIWRSMKDLLVFQFNDFRKDPDWQTNLLRETQSNLNITKAVITSERNYLFTHLYGFDLIRTFDQFKLCAKYNKIEIKPKQDCGEAITSLLHSRNETLSVNIIATCEKGEIREEIYFCERFHLQSTCIRENIYPSIYNISNNGSLTIRNSKQEQLQSFSAEQYIPLERGFQICRVDNSEKNEFRQYHWLPRVENIKSYISQIGTVLSLICYVAFLVVFAKVPAIRNRGAFYVTVIVVFLLCSDILFLTTSYIETEIAICKWFGMVFYWFMLNVLIWSVIVAIDIALQFTKTFSRPPTPEETVSVLRKRLGMTIVISLIIVLMIIGLEESNAVSFHFEKRCWFGDFYLSLGFYFIPAIIGYMLCFVCLCIVLGSIRKRKSEVKQTLNKDSKKDSDLVKIGIKLMLILGITELLGLIQIKSDYLTENEQIFNSVFGLLYVLTRSFRGVLIFMVYMVNRKMKEQCLKTLQEFQQSFGTRDSSVYV